MAELARRHGAPDVMRLQLGGLSNVIISSPEAAKQVMQTHDLTFASRPFLLAPDPQGLHPVAAQRQAGPGLNQALLTVAENISDIQAGFRVSDLYPSLTFLPVLSGFEAKLERMHQGACSVLDAIIDERQSRRSSMSNSENDEEEEEEEYLVDVLLRLQEHPNELGFPITTEMIKAVTLELFVAGIDTSSKLIEWTMSEMIKQPRVMQKAQEEVRRVFDGKGNVDEASLHQLKYLDCVIKESLRLHPPAPFLVPRESRERAQLCGYEIPTKTIVIVNVWAICRDPLYWLEPEKFFPERFVDSSTDYKGSDFQLSRSVLEGGCVPDTVSRPRS
ncbi:unnamed protein product [Linum tenue]|uniref:Cytochrome P450 n=1 Tax=Linum tenue TaxID=586396 RepID=A0AAV0II58_9ROSI|nr:unnamed protein product [Linum tenue]